MPATFFRPHELPTVNRVAREPDCGRCGLWKGCNSPKMEPSGSGRKRILILAEAPGSEEDLQGVQLVGNSGRELMSRLANVGIDMRRDCWLHNALACRPPKNEIPDEKMIDYCRPKVVQVVKDLDPVVIIPLGAVAVESLLGWVWKAEDVGGIGRWAGFRIPDQTLNAWVCPTYHPAHVLRSKDPVIAGLTDKHLEAASKLLTRPWETVPDYRKEVRVVRSPSEAADLIDAFNKSGLIAFDYETNMLKPDGPDAEIVCCSVSNGETTIAFPWAKPAVGAMKRLLQNKRVGKWGWNAKFEHRWSARFGIKVRGWKQDGMLSSHGLFCGGKGRPVTGLKFQAYVHLGVGDYDSHITPYLKAVDGTGVGKNRVREVDPDDLLLYCGMDSLLEFKVNLILRTMTRRR